MRAQDSSDGMPYLSLEPYCESDNLRGSGDLRVCYDSAPWEKSNAAPVEASAHARRETSLLSGLVERVRVSCSGMRQSSFRQRCEVRAV